MAGDDTDERTADRRAAARMDEESGGQPAETPPGAPDPGGEKAETYYRNWQRAAADFANYKRRVEQDRGESARLATAAVAINLLPVFDDLDRAVASVDASLAGLNWVQGVVMIHQKFARLLESMGVTEIAADGAAFDPAQHEAVGQQPGEDGKILHVVQKGYALQGKVIRPAMVIVGEAPG